MSVKMEKLPMCRICLVENVRMYVVVNRNLHKLYEKLTDIPFVTEDIRPILACFFCCTKLKQCYQLLTLCLEAEELFAQRMTGDYEPNRVIKQDHYSLSIGLVKSPIVHISIVDECQTESIDVTEEVPADCEGQDDVIEPKEEYESDDPEQENLDEICLDIADIPPRHSESDLEDDDPLKELKTDEEEVPEKKRRDEIIRATATKEPKLDTLKPILEDTITPEQTKKEKSNTQDIRITRIGTSNRGTYFIEPEKYDERNFNHVKKNVHHTRTQIGVKLKCVCQSSFSDKGNPTKHIRIQTGEKPYKCDVCQQSFSSKSNFNKHLLIHTDEKPYKCDVCQRSFRQNAHLKSHIRIHSGEKPFKCDECLQSFSQKSYLNQHIRIHSGEKPYKCDVCQRSFRENRHLITHIRTHTGEKPYKCDVCQQSFSVKGTLNQHFRIHIGKKPYKCDVCQRSFREKSYLKNHIRIHTGEKPYKCDVCQQSFSLKCNFNQHIRIHSKVLV